MVTINHQLTTACFFTQLVAISAFTAPLKKTSVGKVVNEVFETRTQQKECTRLSMSEWSDFKALDDDDDLYGDLDNDLPPAGKMTELGYADENDPQELKAEVGSNIAAPPVDWFGEPLFLPVGSVIPLTEENVQAVLAACRQEIGTMFGYSAENRGVGITGGT